MDGTGNNLEDDSDFRGRWPGSFTQNVVMTNPQIVIIVRLVRCEGLSPSFFFFLIVTCMISGLLVCTVAHLATIAVIVYHGKVWLVRSVYSLRARCQHLPAVRGVAPACAVMLRGLSWVETADRADRVQSSWCPPTSRCLQPDCSANLECVYQWRDINAAPPFTSRCLILTVQIPHTDSSPETTALLID